MHFSQLADQLVGSKNPLYVIHDELRAEGTAIVDLVRGNVNAHGIVYPADLLAGIFAQALEQARVYVQCTGHTDGAPGTTRQRIEHAQLDPCVQHLAPPSPENQIDDLCTGVLHHVILLPGSPF